MWAEEENLLHKCVKGGDKLAYQTTQKVLKLLLRMTGCRGGAIPALGKCYLPQLQQKSFADASTDCRVRNFKNNKYSALKHNTIKVVTVEDEDLSQSCTNYLKFAFL